MLARSMIIIRGLPRLLAVLGPLRPEDGYDGVTGFQTYYCI